MIRAASCSAAAFRLAASLTAHDVSAYAPKAKPTANRVHLLSSLSAINAEKMTNK
jgi:hypothetical protein